MHRTTTLEIIFGLGLALGLSTTLVGCDGGAKKTDAKAETKTDAKADAKAGDVKADDAKADDAKADDAKADAPAAAGDNPLIGLWTLDPEGFKEVDEYKNAPDDQKKTLDAMMGSMKADLSFTEGELSMTVSVLGQEKSMKGTYTVKSNEGGKLTIESEMDGKKEEVSLTVNGDKLVMIQGGDTLAFKKKG